MVLYSRNCIRCGHEYLVGDVDVGICRSCMNPDEEAELNSRIENAKCEFCRKNVAQVEGYFYTAAKNNPFAQGTAAAGLLQLRKACRSCAQRAIDSGMTPAKELPSDDILGKS